MFERALEIIKENIIRLNESGISEAEVYLGTSNICESLKNVLDDIGWNVLYIEKGFYLLRKN